MNRPAAGASGAARLLLEYDGAEFAGWARQPGQRTVQEVLEEALRRVLEQPVELTVAGRTDAGVHARGQVASHPGEPAPAHALNGVLPADVRVLASDPAPEGFDARRDALSRTYRYRVEPRSPGSPFERGRALHWPRRSTATRSTRARRRCAARTTSRRSRPPRPTTSGSRATCLRAEWVEEPGGVLAFWIEAETFMRHMVRVLVGTMLGVAGGGGAWRSSSGC